MMHKYRQQTIAPQLLLLALVLTSFLQRTDAIPYIALTAPKRCMTYDHPHDVILVVKYEVFGK